MNNLEEPHLQCDYDDDGDDNDDDNEVSNNKSMLLELQLGFISEDKNMLFDLPDWREWDGGKVGGCPSWLNPMHIPSELQLKCRFCDNSQMNFLMQVTEVSRFTNSSIFSNIYILYLDILPY